jgi:hypothetical protein
MTGVLWSEHVDDVLDDRWQAHLERLLGLRFHGVHSAGASTVAHRFVLDSDEDALVLRVRIDPHRRFSVELLAIGGPSHEADEHSDLRSRVRAALRSGEHDRGVRETAAAPVGEVAGLLLDLSSALHDLTWSEFEHLSARERRNLAQALREALPPIQAAADTAETASVDEARRINELLVNVVGETVGSTERSTGRGHTLGELLSGEIDRNPDAVLKEGTFEATAAEFLADIERALAEWNQAAAPKAQFESAQARLSQRTLANVLAKLDARTRETHRHVLGIVDVSPTYSVRVIYSRGRGLPPRRVTESLRRSMYLNQTEFRRLVSCAMTREEFVAVVRGRVSET